MILILVSDQNAKMIGKILFNKFLILNVIDSSNLQLLDFIIIKLIHNCSYTFDSVAAYLINSLTV